MADATKIGVADATKMGVANARVANATQPNSGLDFGQEKLLKSIVCFRPALNRLLL